MPNNPEGPQPFPCGGTNQPACPGQPAILTTGVNFSEDEPLYTYREMQEHGAKSYAKGVADCSALDRKEMELPKL